MFYSGPHVKKHFMSTTKGNSLVKMCEVLVKFFFEVWGCKAKHSGTIETLKIMSLFLHSATPRTEKNRLFI